MLRPNALGEMLEVAALSGISIEYVETNSSWFKDIASAVNMLTMLKRKGLRTLLVSISPFHNEYIPFSKVSGTIKACNEAGIHVFPWINDFVKDLTKFNPNETHSIGAFEKIYGKDYLSSVLKRYWIHMGGRALDTFRPVLDQWPYEQILENNQDGCAFELSDTSHFHIDLFSNYIPGLCSGLSIATHDLGKPLSEKKYPVLNTLFRLGVRGIYDLAYQTFKFRPSRSGYINKCDLCTEIRTFLVEKGTLDLAELSPKRFYRDRR
ncbi:MAG: hypothetical protein JSV38_00985 [Desulfobacterales bacterium]|nr:MAG: hypothetical protein JSV38_00985 [Desulfobacterales bacterium]